MSDLVTYTLNGDVATIAMDDGKANVISHAMLDALHEALDKAEAAKAVVLLKGRENRFSGGFDLKEMYKGPKEAVALTCRGSEFALRLMKFPTPVIGVSTGHCVAMGAFVMLACDFRLGAAGDFKVGLNETQIGMTMHDFGIELARYKIPKNWFNRTAINGELMGPDDAVSAGFYDKTVPAEQLDATADMVGNMMAKLNMTAFNGTKSKSRRDVFAVFDAAIETDRKMAISIG